MNISEILSHTHRWMDVFLLVSTVVQLSHALVDYTTQTTSALLTGLIKLGIVLTLVLGLLMLIMVLHSIVLWHECRQDCIGSLSSVASGAVHQFFESVQLHIIARISR